MRTRAALPALFAGAVLIGLAPIFVRLVDVGLTAAGFWRVALAAPLLCLLWRRSDPQAPWLPPGWPLLALAGLCFAGDLALWHQSVARTSVANATLMANLAPVFVAGLGYLLFRERLSRGFWAGMVLALLGAATLMGQSLRLSPETLAGDLLGIGAAVFYAGYLMSVARARSRRSVLEVMAWTSGVTALALLPLTLGLGEPLWPQSARGWAVLAGLALLSHVAGQGLIAYAMAGLPAVLSAVGLLVQPLAAALFAWWLLQEPFGPQQALGGAVILAGIVQCRLAGLRRPRPAVPAPIPQ
jgi:drug/metabolite transporter (DMT)-like permease